MSFLNCTSYHINFEQNLREFFFFFSHPIPSLLLESTSFWVQPILIAVMLAAWLPEIILTTIVVYDSKHVSITLNN